MRANASLATDGRRAGCSKPTTPESYLSLTIHSHNQPRSVNTCQESENRRAPPAETVFSLSGSGKGLTTVRLTDTLAPVFERCNYGIDVD